MTDFARPPEFEALVQIASIGGGKGPEKAFGSRPPCRFARDMGSLVPGSPRETESLRSRLADCARLAQLEGPVAVGSGGACSAPSESLWSRPPHRLAHEMPRLATEGGRKVIGRWMANFACSVEFEGPDLIASDPAPEALAATVGRWSVCRLAREMQRFVRPDIPEESCP